MLTTEDREEIRRIVGEEVIKIPRLIEESVGAEALVAVTAHAIEILGNREKALNWLRTPVRSLGGNSPLSLLNSPEGIAKVEDTLGQIEHGIW